jgi:hypothetical protein
METSGRYKRPSLQTVLLCTPIRRQAVCIDQEINNSFLLIEWGAVGLACDESIR